MMRILGLAFLGLLVVVVVAMLWQHQRYLHARRAFVQDHQPLLYGSDVFHVVTFLELAPGDDLFERMRALRDRVEAGGRGKLVYAGKVALNAGQSAQLVEAFGEPVDWDAVALVQYESRDAWEATRAGEPFAGFARTYSHGMNRSALQNLMLPQAFLLVRVRQWLTGSSPGGAFEPVPEEERQLPTEAPLERLSAERELGADAAVVVNLVQRGSEAEQAADREYVGAMFERMAAIGNGPMHVGDAVTLERDTRYDGVAIVYYPGVDYFRSMLESRFFNAIIGNKQLGDNQSSITVPILDRL